MTWPAARGSLADPIERRSGFAMVPKAQSGGFTPLIELQDLNYVVRASTT